MRFIKTELKTSGRVYWSITDSGLNVSYLEGFLFQMGSSAGTLLKMIEEDDIGGGFSASFIFTVEPNIYIGGECYDMRWQQCIVFKDEPRYFFRTTKQGFIDLIKQWVKLYEQRPPGISVEEVSTDVWQVRPMTKEDVERCKSSR
ncbi:hypothetical protein HOK96_01425 [bacterium]|nr:hypothetical protein [bacterium]MBT5338157.1 hypothetical protein [Candidatus Falkowbacteria bacterium]MBT3903369.1 hypothetical protein [bacterium]MBT4578055.1 hypothetical protein [bacterium]MBT5345695.1 hypothetical protein [bacterium]